ncbi:MAG: FkbM family methyltransferase [Flavobacteriales bacterium]|nr:FkbM family methyltransferase [Flavobacteriales bacterium]
MSKEKVFLDVGINLGQTLIKVKAVHQAIHYIGFEPNPQCVCYTNEVIKANAFGNTEIFPVGIGEQSTILKLNLFSDSDHDSAASVVEDFRGPERVKKSINVPIFSGSDLPINTDSEIGIIKIDVEGAELEVLKGLKDQIDADRPFVMIEILPVYNRKNQQRLERQNEIQKLLSQWDYSIFRVIKSDDKFIDLIEIDSFEVHSDLNLCEYILTPNERKSKLVRALTVTDK